MRRVLPGHVHQGYYPGMYTRDTTRAIYYLGYMPPCIALSRESPMHAVLVDSTADVNVAVSARVKEQF